MEINQIIDAALINAARHKWKIRWDKSLNPDITVGEALALCHSELSEALEAYRHNEKESFSEEIADEIIRLCHMCGDLNIDIEAAIIKKMKINKSRDINHGKANL